jgi:hypothetical protein
MNKEIEEIGKVGGDSCLLPVLLGGPKGGSEEYALLPESPDSAELVKAFHYIRSLNGSPRTDAKFVIQVPCHSEGRYTAPPGQGNGKTGSDQQSASVRPRSAPPIIGSQTCLMM